MQLKELVFPELSIGAVMPEAADKVRPMELADLDIKFSFSIIKEESLGFASLSIRSKRAPEIEQCLNYKFDIKAFAAFHLDETEPVDAKLEFTRKFNAAATLVGALREQLAQLTSRGPWGVTVMPMIPLQQLAGKYPDAELVASTKKPSLRPGKRIKARVAAK
ncbi:hypothetical protein [Polaromonas sp.]|uniref:hypothetical protein n=1 Tax=Polaromonas sp. TaxID=1869339 RepID=UPI0037509CCF